MHESTKRNNTTPSISEHDPSPNYSELSETQRGGPTTLTTLSSGTVREVNLFRMAGATRHILPPGRTAVAYPCIDDFAWHSGGLGCVLCPSVHDVATIQPTKRMAVNVRSCTSEAEVRVVDA